MCLFIFTGGTDADTKWKASYQELQYTMEEKEAEHKELTEKLSRMEDSLLIGRYYRL